MLPSLKEANLSSYMEVNKMRRMYSEQELTRIIGEVFDQKLESGALDSSISDAVDAYLVEHPVDITALEGQDIAPKDIAATGDITADSIIENMSGYTASCPVTTEHRAVNNIYVSVCKNGNKITFVMFGSVTLLDEDITPEQATFTFTFGIPSEVGSKLYPFQVGTGYYLDIFIVPTIQKDDWTKGTMNVDVVKVSNTAISFVATVYGMTLNKEKYFRIEKTFLLSDNMAS